MAYENRHAGKPGGELPDGLRWAPGVTTVEYRIVRIPGPPPPIQKPPPEPME